MSAEVVSEFSKRDKDAYDAICKQIEREDSLYNARFNYWMLVNFGLAAVASKQFDPNEGIFIRICIFIGSCLIAIVMAWFVTRLLSLSDKQVAYLRKEYRTGFIAGKFDGLPRPFFSEDPGCNSEQQDTNNRAGAWKKLVTWVVIF